MFKLNPRSAIQSSLIAASFTLSAFSLNAQAALTSYKAAGGVDVVYSSVSDVTWTKDANLLGTLIAASTDANNNGTKDVIESIITTGATNGITVTAADFTSSGQASWLGSLAYVSYLNSINYGGSNQWYLPTVANTSFGFNTATNGTTKGDELVELFYSELNGTAGSAIPNTTTFDNEKSSSYWSGTEYAPSPNSAWRFVTHSGTQDRNAKIIIIFYAWAVSPGQIAAVPEPQSMAMLMAGLAVLAGVGRRRRG